MSNCLHPAAGAVDAACTAPPVSVVIPVCHVEQWLRECLNSVISQTYEALDIILVDDGSGDACSRICDEYAENDSRIRVVHQPNRGLGNARNTGMDLARGKYIIFLDSDDFWKRDTVEQLCRTAESDQLQVVVFSAEVLFDGVEPFRCLDYTHSAQNYVVRNGYESLRCARDHGEYYSQACLRFYLLSYLRGKGFRFDEGIVHEDESFSFLAYLFADRTECMGERFYTRRYRPGSIMLTLDPARSAEGMCKAMDTVFHYSRIPGLSKEVVRLCAEQMVGYRAVVFSRCKQAGRIPGRSARRICRAGITETAEKTFREIRRRGRHLPLRSRLLFCHFRIGYSFWFLKSAAKKVLCLLKPANN